MKDAIIIQHASEASAAKHVGLYYNRHIQYCIEHDFDYLVKIGPVRYVEHPAWSKFILAVDAFNQGYEYVIWMDTDAFIADSSVDLRDACISAFNMTEWTSPLKHLQAGVVYMNNGNGYALAICQALLSESKYYLEYYPQLRGWYEQGQLNQLAQIPTNARHFRHLPLCWNYNASLCGSLPENEQAVVLAWHGIPEPQRTVELTAAVDHYAAIDASIKERSKINLV